MRELGIMQLDEQVRWIDVPISERECETSEELPPPPEWLDQAFEDEGPKLGQREDIAP